MKQAPRRKRTSSNRDRALEMIGTLRRFANRELTALEMKREGFHLEGAVAKVRSRLRRFFRQAESKIAKSRRRTA
jgi:hypothetical protein